MFEDFFKSPEEAAKDAELYLKVKEYLFSTYEPGNAIRMSTSDIFGKLQLHIPGEFYKASDVAKWMLEGNFETHTVGDMHIEWLMKRRAK